MKFKARTHVSLVLSFFAIREMFSGFDTKLKTGGMDPLVALDLFVSKF